LAGDFDGQAVFFSNPAHRRKHRQAAGDAAQAAADKRGVSRVAAAHDSWRNVRLDPNSGSIVAVHDLTFMPRNGTASLIGRLGSSAFRLSTVAVSMSLARPLFSPESAPRALPIWDPKTRWNNLARGLAVSNTAGPSGFTNSPHPSSREGDHSTTRWNSSFLLLQLFRPVLMRRRPLPSSTGSRCHPSTCGA
jgi:hypothetical protein